MNELNNINTMRHFNYNAIMQSYRRVRSIILSKVVSFF